MTSPALTPEEELAAICGLARAALGTEKTGSRDWQTLVGRLAPERFEALLKRHRLGAFLAKRLPPETLQTLPKESAAKLVLAAAESARASLGRAGELVRLIRACEHANLPVMGVKGVVLAQDLYGNVTHRHSGDIDLVFRPDQVAAADALLREHGYVRTIPDFELTPRQQREYLELKPEFEYWSAASRIRVELHWRLEGLDDGEVWREPAHCKLGGREIGTLPETLNLRYLCEHGARHGWFRLFWLVDVAVLLIEKNPDPAELHEAARLAGKARSLAQALQLSAELLGVPARPEWTAMIARENASERRTIARLTAEARRLLVAPEDGAGRVIEWARQVRYRAALSASFSDKWRTLKPHLHSPLGWSMVRLPDRWFWLYQPLTPILWLARRLFRNRRTSTSR